MDKASTILYTEHELIADVLGFVAEADKLIQRDPVRYTHTVEVILEFFRKYADQYHHYKEEQVLFPEMTKKNEVLRNGAIKEMIENHDDFRDMLSNAETFLRRKDFTETSRQLHMYAANMKSHIFTENREVFQLMEKLFSPAELEDMCFRFTAIDKELGQAEKHRLEALMSALIVETSLLS